MRTRGARSGAVGSLLVALCLSAGCGTTVPSRSLSQDSTTGAGDVGLSTGDGPSGTAAGPATTPVATRSAAGSLPGGPKAPAEGPASVLGGSAGSDTTGAVPALPSMPVSGPGWDAKNVYVGIAIESDASTIGKAIGFASFDFGDQRGMINAAVADLNRRGGLLGRQVRVIFYDTSSSTDPTQEAQEACALWTQDHRVVTVSLVGRLNIGSMYECLKKSHTPASTSALGGISFLSRDLAQYAPYLNFVDGAAMDRFADTWIDRLTALGYFHGWNTTTGEPGPAPVKVGILYSDDPINVRAWAVVKTALERRHIAVPDMISWNGSNVGTFSNDVLKFKADGVTHVFLDSAAGVFYPTQAQNQHYFARYGVTSNSYIQPFLVNGAAPKAQLRGMMGVGWQPYLDVDQTESPPLSDEQRRDQAACLQVMRKAGIDVSKRNYQFVAFSLCDGMRFAAEKVRASHGFSPEALYAGQSKIAPTFDSTVSIAVGAHVGPDLLSKVRGLEYDSSCSCTRYVGPVVTLPNAP